MPAAPAPTPERLEFRTELKQLLDLIIHSLYTKKEIFLRELISNAADAIDKVRFEALKDPALAQGDTDWKIKLTSDAEAGTLTVSDNGIGMSRDAIVDNLGTIAKSGTRAFLDSLKQADVKDRPELIGQFGVGFYASFMVADRVTVVSRPAGGAPTDAIRWESDGQGEYTIAPAERASRGTDVTLHLRDDAKEFLEPWRLRSVVKAYSDFIEHPIVADAERPDEPEPKEGEPAPAPKAVVEETLNSRQAIWLRPKAEIKEEEYAEFYKQISRDFDPPLKTIHLAADGTVEFRSILFLPAHKPFDFVYREPKSSVALYVRRVLIQAESEDLLPPYLRFVRGVVDSADLPLNVSRETLQHNPVLARIRSNLVNRVLRTLDEMKGGDYETYLKFYKEFGTILKEGVSQDFEHRDRIADLLLFESTRTEPGKYTTLAKYLEGMAAGQKEIFYLAGETRQQLENSPYLERFKAGGQEVLFLTDPFDEFVVQSLRQFKEKALKPVDRGQMDEPDEAAKTAGAQLKPLLDAVKAKLPDVKDVRVSTRLKESAACLVADDGAMGAHMERIMQRLGRDDVPAAKRILELNAEHPVVRAMEKIHAKDPADPRLESYALLLYDQAVLAEGSKLKDPAAFARRLNEVLARDSAAT